MCYYFETGSRPRPLAPTCNVCLIKDDLGTIWCEVTSSIWTRSVDNEVGDAVTSSSSGEKSSDPVNEKNDNSASRGSTNEESSPKPANVVRELLLCLRPIRDGEEKVGEELRFCPPSHRGKKEEEETGRKQNQKTVALPVVTKGTTASTNHVVTPLSMDTSPSGTLTRTRGPMKKRVLSKSNTDSNVSSDMQQVSSSNSSKDEDVHQASRKKSRLSPMTSDTEKSVVESLMLMSHNAKS